MKARKKVIQGGTSAGKTYAVIPILIDRAIKVPNLKITIVAETLPAVRGGAMDIFKKIMQETNRWNEDSWAMSPEICYTFSSGSRIFFKAFDTPGKAKADGKRDILFINEANHVSFEIADMLITRSLEVYLDFNADIEFWAHTEVATESNAELLILTYKDNEALPAETYEELMSKKAKGFHDVNAKDLYGKDNIKSKYWCNWWRVYGDGLIGNISELRIMPILNKWNDPIPDDAQEIPSALDFGFFPDPTAFCRLWVRPKEITGKQNDELYIKLVVYDTKLSIDANSVSGTNLVKILKEKGVNPSHHIIAENADPRARTDMAQAGFSIEAVKKTTVETSIRKFHEYDIYIVGVSSGGSGGKPDGSGESDQCYIEFDDYQYKKDKATNKILGIPKEGQDDHTIDGVRYVLMSRGARWEVKK